MRYLLAVPVLVLILYCNVEASEVIADASYVNGNTLITCVPAEGGYFDKAYLTLYETDGDLLAIRRREMDVSYDNEASYVLEGIHNVIEGKCKFVLSGERKGIAKGEFTISRR